MVVVILGGGGHGSDILSLLDSVDESHDVVVFDEGEPSLDRFASRPVRVASAHDAVIAEEPLFIGGVGYPAARRAFVERAERWGWTPVSPIVHPSVEVMYGVELGAGSAVMGLTWISPNVHLAEHVYVGYGVKLGHDAVVGDFASVFPGVFLAGNVTVGEGAMVGANATVLPGVRIGAWAQVGAGAVVTHDVPDGVTVVGSPAVPVRGRS